MLGRVHPARLLGRVTPGLTWRADMFLRGVNGHRATPVGNEM